MIPGARTLQILSPGEAVSLDRSRCLRQRFSPAECRRCLEACPHGAIGWGDGGLTWSEAACKACLLCVATCPTGAFRAGELSLAAVLGELAGAERPVLACSGQPNCSGHARVPCLGLLAHADMLLAVHLPLGKPLRLNLTRCEKCPNGSIVSRLTDVAATLAELDLSKDGDLFLIHDPERLGYQEAVCTRRELFTLMGRKSRRAASTLVDRLQERPISGINREKKLPPGRELLLRVLDLLPEERRPRIADKLFPRLESSAQCIRCTGCVGICPTGAIAPAEEGGEIPRHDLSRCTGCRLCEQFCSRGGIRVSTP